MKASYIKKSLLKTINSMSRDIKLFVKRPGMDFSRNRKCSFHSILTCILSLNRVGGGREAADLSHHRAYRSVHGGSINLTSNTPFGVVI